MPAGIETPLDEGGPPRVTGRDTALDQIVADAADGRRRCDGDRRGREGHRGEDGQQTTKGLHESPFAGETLDPDLHLRVLQADLPPGGPVSATAYSSTR